MMPSITTNSFLALPFGVDVCVDLMLHTNNNRELVEISEIKQMFICFWYLWSTSRSKRWVLQFFWATKKRLAFSWNCSKSFNFDDKTKISLLSEVVKGKCRIYYCSSHRLAQLLFCRAWLKWNRNIIRKFPPNSINYITSSRPIYWKPYHVEIVSCR